MGMCLNRKVLVGLGIALVAVAALAPQTLPAALPVLVLLACPLSMVAMMWAMRGARGAGEQPGASCHTASSRTDASPEDRSAEIRRLRAEVDQLHAGLHARQSGHRSADARKPSGEGTLISDSQS